MTLKIKRKDVGEDKIELQITAPAASVDEAIGFATMQMAYQNGINPASENLMTAVIDKVGEAYYKSALSFAVSEFIAPFAVTQEKLSIIMRPQVAVGNQEVAPGREFSFKATVTRKPQYELKSYDPVSIKIQKAKVSDAEVKAQMAGITENFAAWEKDEDKPLSEGDDLMFKISAIDSDGEEIKNLTADRRLYTLGQNFMPDGFDENLVGMNIGEEKTFEMLLPGIKSADPENPTDADKVTITVQILERQKRVIPALTDAWVKKSVPGCNNIAELEDQIRQQMLGARENETQNMTAYFAASELAKRFEGKIADEFYEFTRGELMAQMEASLRQQGRTLQEFIETEGGGQQGFSMQMMLQVREMLIQGFSLDALARHLNLKVEPEDIEATYSQMAPGKEDMARQEFEKTGRLYLIYEGALRNKANKWLVETAEIEYVES